MQFTRPETFAALEEIRKTGQRSDLTIVCGNMTFHVHKSVLAANSTWFERACRASRWKEGSTNFIELEAITGSTEEEEDYSCDHPLAVLLMMQWVYFGEYLTESKLLSCENMLCSSEVRHLLEYIVDADGDRGYTWRCSSKAGGISRKPAQSELTETISTRGQKMDSPFTNALTYHARVHALARKYDVVGLGAYAASEFQKASGQDVNAADLAQAIRVAGHTAQSLEDDPILAAAGEAVLADKEGLWKSSEVRAILAAAGEAVLADKEGLWKSFEVRAAVDAVPGLLWIWCEKKVQEAKQEFARERLKRLRAVSVARLRAVNQAQAEWSRFDREVYESMYGNGEDGGGVESRDSTSD